MSVSKFGVPFGKKRKFDEIHLKSISCQDQKFINISKQIEKEITEINSSLTNIKSLMKKLENLDLQKLDQLDTNVVNEQIKAVSNSLNLKHIEIKRHVENQEKKLERLLGSTEKKLTILSNKIYTDTKNDINKHITNLEGKINEIDDKSLKILKNEDVKQDIGNVKSVIENYDKNINQKINNIDNNLNSKFKNLHDKILQVESKLLKFDNLKQELTNLTNNFKVDLNQFKDNVNTVGDLNEDVVSIEQRIRNLDGKFVEQLGKLDLKISKILAKI